MRLYNRIKNKLNSFFAKPVVVPSYEVKRETLSSYQKKFGLKTLVETGTFMGDTVEYFKQSFDWVFSIELAEDLARNAMKRFEHDKNVTIIQGDSGVVLKEIVSNSKQPILFWLDGHYSSEFFMGDVFIKTARTDVDTPIVEELRTILASKLEHVILIDDARLFSGLGDYPSIGKVRRLVRGAEKRRKVTVENDIIRITPTS